MPSQPTQPELVDLLLHLFRSDRAVRDLQAYFCESDNPYQGYTGRHFERLSGGGDRPDVADRITADDLIAVQTLSVTVPAKVSVQLLDGDLGRQVSAHLRAIPSDASLLDLDAAEHLADDSPADRCWQLLVSDAAPGVGATTAGKLLARKRPHLIPVYDDVLRCALGHPAKFWTSLHHALLQQPDLRTALASLRKQAPPHVSAIRVLDVVVWMSHENEHRTFCRAGAITAVPPD